MNDHEELAARFASLRREEAGTAPPFRLPTPRAGGSSRRWLLVPVAAVGAALLWALAIRPATDSRPGPALVSIDLGATTWVGPTDFLLNTPGSEFLRTLPALRYDYRWVEQIGDTLETSPSEGRLES